MKKKVLVTGGLGFVGATVSTELINRGHDVIILDWDEKVPQKLIAKSRVVHGDIRDAELVSRLVSKVDCVFHFAGVLGTSELFDEPMLAVDINVGGAINVLDAIRNCSEQKSAYFCTQDCSWNNIYSMTSQAVESSVHSYREAYLLDLSVVEMRNLYGPGQKNHDVLKVVPDFIQRALRGLPLQIFGTGQQLVQLSHIECIANAFCDLMEKQIRLDETYGFDATYDISVLDLAKRVIAACHSASTIDYCPMRRGEGPDPKPAIQYKLSSKLEIQETDFAKGLGETITFYEADL